MKSLHISLTEMRNESRLLKEAASLIDSGLMSAVHVAALHADGLQETQCIKERIHVRRIALVTRQYGKNLAVQLIKYLEFCIRVWVLYRHENIACINVHALGLLPLGVMLKYLWRARLIYDAHELETETNGAKGIRKKLSKWLERRLIKSVDLTIVVSENIADWYAQEYNIPRPLVVLNAPSKRELKKNNHFREQLDIRDDQAILLYQGGLMAGRGVHLILDAFKARKDDRIVVVFMGYGELQNKIQEAARSSGNIFFYPAVSPDMVLDYTSSADFGISLIENTCLSYYYCMPNKLFEYAMAGLPVLVSNMKEMSDLVRKKNMGTVIGDLSVQGINQAIENFSSQDLMTLKSNAYRVAVENSWERQEQEMLSGYRVLGFSKGAI